MSTIQYSVRYEYLAPGPAGPFTGRVLWDGRDRLTAGPLPRKGATVYMPFGIARVLSVRGKATKC